MSLGAHDDTGAPAERMQTCTAPGGVTVISLAGEHDLHSVPAFNRLVARLLADGSCRLVVDLSPTTFIDSRMVGALLGWVQVADDPGPLRLRLVMGDPQAGPISLLRAVGDERLLPLERSLDDAVAALAATG